jgi:AraC-like DNA-binding protein
MHDKAAGYLNRFPVFRTADPEEMRAAMLETYGALDVEYPDTVEGFYGCGNLLRLGSVAFSYCSYGAPVRVRFPAADFVRQQFGLHGHSLALVGGKIVESRPDQSCVVSSGTDVTVDFGRSFEQLVVRVDERALEHKLTALIGAPPPGRLEFSVSEKAGIRHAQEFRELVLAFVNLFSTVGADFPAAVLDEIQQTIVVSFLSVNRHNYSRLLDAEPKETAPWQVKRVEEYIETHWNDPLTIERLAAVADTSARSIFKAFKRSRGYSPIGFAKQIRLKHARARLLFGDASTTVTAVALACGFANLGHFAKDYQRAFGELPSATLARGKR